MLHRSQIDCKPVGQHLEVVALRTTELDLLWRSLHLCKLVDATVLVDEEGVGVYIGTGLCCIRLAPGMDLIDCSIDGRQAVEEVVVVAALAVDESSYS